MRLLNDSDRARFEAKFKIVDSGCWIWQAADGGNGYGKIWDGEIVEQAHRFSYRLYRGEIRDSLYVCHKCDVTQCVNPEHLFLGTAKDNTADCIAKGRARRGITPKNAKTHCPQGHELRPDTVYVSGGYRKCAICCLARVKARYQRKRLGNRNQAVA